jgi:hypothetical protein
LALTTLVSIGYLFTCFIQVSATQFVVKKQPNINMKNLVHNIKTITFIMLFHVSYGRKAGKKQNVILKNSKLSICELTGYKISITNSKSKIRGLGSSCYYSKSGSEKKITELLWLNL